MSFFIVFLCIIFVSVSLLKKGKEILEKEIFLKNFKYNLFSITTMDIKVLLLDNRSVASLNTFRISTSFTIRPQSLRNIWTLSLAAHFSSDKTFETASFKQRNLSSMSKLEFQRLAASWIRFFVIHSALSEQLWVSLIDWWNITLSLANLTICRH